MAERRGAGEGLLTVSALARCAGVPPSTIRYYERRGLLSPASRSASGYRLFDAQTLARVRFILAAKEAGFALEDVRRLLDLDARPGACAKVQALIDARLARVVRERNRLEAIEAALTRWRRLCAAQGDACRVIETLTVAAGADPACAPSTEDDHDAA